jgi:hypothetical protein
MSLSKVLAAWSLMAFASVDAWVAEDRSSEISRSFVGSVILIISFSYNKLLVVRLKNNVKKNNL